MLAGEIDLTLPTGIDVESALTVQDQWQGTQNRVLLGSNGRLRMALAQSREEAARPRALLDPRVRQALFRAVDRQAISEAISRGMELNPILAVAGVKNVNPPTHPIQLDAFNAWEWDKE